MVSATKTRAFLALIAGGVAIGFAGIFMRLSDVSPVASAFWRMALAAPVLWLWSTAATHGGATDGKRGGFSLAVLWAGMFFAADMAVWHLSLHYTTVANATLLPNFAPLVIAGWLFMRFGTRYSKVFFTGMALALLGAVLLVRAKSITSVAMPDKFLGDILGMATAVFYASYQLAVKDARNHYSTARLMAWSTTITAACLLPLALLSAGSFWPGNWQAWIPLVALALVAQVFGQTVIAYAVAHLPASLSSVSLLVQPLTATLVAWMLFGEALGPWQGVGGAMLLIGIYLSKRGS